MTRINIQGVEYDLTGAVSAAGLGDLFTLKVKTAAHKYPVTLKSINELFVELGERAKAGDFEPVDMLGDEKFLMTFIGILWLAKRKSGEPITFEDAWGISFTEFFIVPDEDDEEPESDPKVLTPDSVPADEPTA